jgi:hypothetical protein
MDQARRALQECLAELDLEERLVLRMHYESGLTLAAIASTLGMRLRQLYTRRDRFLRTLRASLERRGLNSQDVLAALRRTEDGRQLDFQVRSPEDDDLGPSNHTEAKEDDPE